MDPFNFCIVLQRVIKERDGMAFVAWLLLFETLGTKF
jgi:hypothetical protein